LKFAVLVIERTGDAVVGVETLAQLAPGWAQAVLLIAPPLAETFKVYPKSPISNKSSRCKKDELKRALIMAPAALTQADLGAYPEPAAGIKGFTPRRNSTGGSRSIS
jgi:hypothetical protein